MLLGSSASLIALTTCQALPISAGTSWEVVKRIKRALDPNNVMNPGKQSLDEAYEDGTAG